MGNMGMTVIRPCRNCKVKTEQRERREYGEQVGWQCSSCGQITRFDVQTMEERKKNASKYKGGK